MLQASILLHGQACALLTAVTGATATLLAARGVDAPTAQSAFVYVCLALLILPEIAQKSKRGPERWRGAAVWLALGVADVEANYLVVLAFQRAAAPPAETVDASARVERYTSLTSVMLLDCFTIPCVMLLSRVFLAATYEAAHARAGASGGRTAPGAEARTQVRGALVCVLGVGLTVASDVLPRDYGGAGLAGESADRLLGDACCLAGALLYAVSNVAQEKLVRDRGNLAFLGRLGVAGALVSALQASVLEREHISRALAAGTDTWLLFGGYVGSMVALYVLTSLFFQRADAASFNLSLLVSDAYAVVFSAVVTASPPPPLYYAALATTAAGVCVYHSRESPTAANLVLGRGRAVSFASDASQSPLLPSPGGPLPLVT